jgi:hypothetical protein
MVNMSGVGLLNEKPLHASLKAWYAQPGDQVEVKVDGYVIDIVQNDLLVEIQTTNFASIKVKLKKLLDSHRVRLIYPIALEKWIVKSPSDGNKNMIRRKSPKKGRLEDLFWEMVRIPQLMGNRNFSLEVLMIREEEERKFVGKRKWRRKGWATVEHRLLEVVEQHVFATPSDWCALIPKKMLSFTAKDLANVLRIRPPLAQRMVYCFRKANLINLIGNRGRAHLYAMPDN